MKNSYTTEAKSEIFNPDLHMMSKTADLLLENNLFSFMQNQNGWSHLQQENCQGNKLQLIGLDLNDFESKPKNAPKYTGVRENFLKQIQFIDDFRRAITRHNLGNSGLSIWYKIF